MADRSSANDSSTDSSGDDEDSESSASSSSNSSAVIECQDGEIILNQFRENWRAEIRERKDRNATKRPTNSKGARRACNDEEDACVSAEEAREGEAKRLFRLGTREESNGNFYLAIEYYRRAYQLLPDVELRIAQQQTRRRRNSHRKRLDSGSSVDSNGSTSQEVRGAEGRTSETLYHVVEGDESQDGDTNNNKSSHADPNSEEADEGPRWNGWCQPEVPLASNKTRHISDLPVEVMFYIFKWIVGSHLDVRALDQLSLVCRCFCQLARDEELWRLVCLRIWGANCGLRPTDFDFPSWRAMAIHRPHVLLNGSYMGRIRYVRSGEPSLGSVYRPCYVVEYYRSIRFFPDGVFFMMTSPEDPAAHVRLLSTRPPSRMAQGILEGHYRLSGNVVTGVLAWRKPPPAVSNWRVSRRRQGPLVPPADQIQQQTFQVQFLLKNSRKKLHNVLEWQSYSFVQMSKSGKEVVCDFNVESDAYPALYFSRVKSYTGEVADEPLE